MDFITEKDKKRSVKLTVRLTPIEYEKVKKNCGDNMMAVWLRELAINQQVKESIQTTTTADPDLLRHLARIGNNLNQIARQLNSGADRVELIAMLSQFEQIHSEFIRIRESVLS